jgi:ArsR family transcriptional regulator, arsenate/arsenite/antimonite-responsive transcriptional repressor
MSMKEARSTKLKARGSSDLEAFARMCKALGHPARIKILQHLKAVDSCICGKIVAVLPLAQSTVSQHLKSLKDAGLIKGEVEGPAICYCIDKITIRKFKKWAEDL